MKKVLILAYDFPPLVSVGGLRPFSWYRHLKEFGVFPVVVTRQWATKHGNHLDYVEASELKEAIIEESFQGIIIKTPYKPNLANRLLLRLGESKFRFFRKMISAWFEFAQFVLFIGPKKELYYAAKRYLDNNKVDAIIATGNPFVLFYYASILSKKYSIPWIADYRDPWVQEKSRKRFWLYRFWDGYFERKYLKNASLITTVSDFLKKIINENLQNKTFSILPNGYDEAILPNGNAQFEKSDKLILAFAGTIYPWHPWGIFLGAVSTWQNYNKTKDFEIRFIGINLENEIRKVVSEKWPDLLACIIFLPKLGMNELVKTLSEAHVFLLFNDYPIAGTKIYNYLALKRKILLCFKNDPHAKELKDLHFHLEEFPEISSQIQENIIAETHGGIVVQDSNHLQQVFDALWSEFHQKGCINCQSKNVEQFSRIKQVEKLADIIKNLSS